MGELVLKMSMSIDGYVAGGRPGSDWMFRAAGPDSAAWVFDTVAGAAVHAFGRRSFESMAGFWSAATVPMATPMNAVRKVVFTHQAEYDPHTLEPAGAVWTGARVANGGLADDIAGLRAEHDGEILAQGGTEFCRSLVRSGLVDEYRLVVLPVALGSGEGVFEGLPRELDLTLVRSTTFSGGAMATVYRPTR